MVIEADLQAQIVDLTNKHWQRHTQDQGFADLINGKEPGHRMADYVDDRTTSLLKVNLDTRYEGDPKAKGSPKKRSMGDIWVNSQGIYNPLNVKSGLLGSKGQPNVVSMRKLLDYIFRRWIDSYYLLIIKFDTSNQITHKAYLVDLLDWIGFISYDAGPGQIMLHEQDFYDAFDSNHIPPEKSILEKTEALFHLFETQVQVLLTNRQARLDKQRSSLEDFLNSDFAVDQSKMRFVL